MRIAIEIRCREVIQQGSGLRADSTLRNNVSLEGLLRRRIDDRIRESREISVAFCRGRHQSRNGVCIADLRPLIAEEELRTVSYEVRNPNRTADREETGDVIVGLLR